MTVFDFEWPDETKNEINGRRLKVRLKHDGIEIATSEPNANSRLIRTSSDRFGDASIARANEFIPGWFELDPQVSGEFHSRHGLFLPARPSSLFPKSLVLENDKVWLQLKHSGGRWRWRVVKSQPSGPTSRALRDLAGQLLEELTKSNALPRHSQASTEGIDVRDVPEWSTADELGFATSDVSQGITVGLRGAAMTLNFEHAPMRMELTAIRTEYVDEGWTVILFEDANSVRLKKDQGHWAKVAAGGRRLEPIAAWELPVAPAEQAGSRRSAGETLRPVLWAHDPVLDEWHRVAFNSHARNSVRGESRRWSLSALLPRFPQSMHAALWLDNCGAKAAHIRLGDHPELDIGLERLHLSLDLDGRFWCVDDDASSELVPRPAGTAGDASGGASTAVLLSTDDSSAPCKLTLEDHGMTLSGPAALHWARCTSGVVGPAGWARNDPSAAIGVSTLRGLIPLKTPDWSMRPNNEAAGLSFSGNGNPTMPTFAIGERLTVVSKAASAHLELELGETDVVVSERHALPQLDSQYAVWAPAADKQPALAVPEALTWVKRRYRAQHPPIELAKLYSELDWTPTEVGLDEGTSTVSTPSWSAATDSPVNVFWVSGKSRWSVAASENLQIALGSALKLVPLRLKLGKQETHDVVEEVCFTIQPNQPGSSRTSEPLLRGRALFWRPNALVGAMVLSADYLRAQQPLAWDDQANAAVRFVGIESTEVEWSAAAAAHLRLKKLRYWFEQEGLDFFVDTDDVLKLQDGKWSIEDANLAALRFGADQKARFVRVQQFAPGLVVTEHLLGPDVGQLHISFGPEEPVIFDVVTTYDPEKPTAGRPHAILRAGSYHLAWAGKKQGAESVDGGAGLTFKALTRLFLQLRRSQDDGRLLATGMVGWQCDGLIVDSRPFGSGNGLATLYANTPGNWSRMRLSGRWDDKGAAAKATRAIILVRHDFELDTEADQSRAIRLSKSITRWLLAAYRSAGGGEAICSRVLDAKSLVEEQRLSLRGDVRFVPYSDKKVGAWKTTLLRPALKLTWAHPIALRDALDALEVSKRVPWFAIELPEAEDAQAGTFAAERHDAQDSSMVLLPAAGTQIGLTRIRDDDTWLLCPVLSAADTSYAGSGRNVLWLLHEGGEDMVEFEGFKEKLDAAMAQPAQAQDLLTRVAEKSLAFMRWRTPAVLESLNGDKVLWTIVDAPLLNPFSSLSFMAPPRGADDALHPTPGLVEDAGSTIHKPIAEVQPAASSQEGYLLLGREAPFEQEPGNGHETWSADSTSRKFPGVVFNRPDTADEKTWSSFVPDTIWKASSPRPGELIALHSEVVSAREGRLWLGARRTMTHRSPRAPVKEDGGWFELHGNDLHWPMPLPLAAAPQTTGNEAGPIEVQLLVGGPNVSELCIGETWPLGITKPSNEDWQLVDDRRIALMLELSVPFAAEIGGLKGEAVSENGKWHLLLILPKAAYGKRHDLMVKCSPPPALPSPLGRLWAGSVTVPVASQHDVPSFTTDRQTWAEAPAGVGLPKPFAVVAQRRPGTGAPYLVALVGHGGRVMAYGPSEQRYDIIFGEHGGNWQAWGHWSAPDAKAPALKLERVVRFGRDGVVSFLPKPP
jgi:hypothetical protein